MIKILNDAEFQLVKDLIYNLSGLDFNHKNKLRLEYKLKERMQQLGYATFNEYYSFLNKRSTSSDIEIKELLDLLTVNETSFFRNKSHFKALNEHVLPEVIESNSGSFMVNPPLSIWSAGCSTGQEPYSILISALEHKSFINSGMSLQIYATDISQTSIEIAKDGIYPAKRLHNMPLNILKKYFIEKNGKIEILQEYRKKVKYMYLNLKKGPFPRNLDIIFCRNVMIYFDDNMRKSVIEKLHRSLKSGGYLFIGHSESLSNFSDLFEFKICSGGIVYKKIGV